ncbi:MAG TPA: hypothetical protein VFE30_09700 [Anaeromyxobacteraceae bacterium]|jgi:hypothetical protein|nr:hypothetical protein [Anaeromyxobacteraceae bacterium]
MTVAAGALLAAGCGSSKTNSTLQTAVAMIGPAPSRVDLPGLASLQVPAGAVSTATSVTLALGKPAAAIPTGAVSKVISLTPHGTQFAAPVTINIAYPATTDPTNLAVLRLPDDGDGPWTQVGGATFSVMALDPNNPSTLTGVASFESMTFSNYVVVGGHSCKATSTQTACTSSCQCCGTAYCVDLATDPHNCGACGNDCGSTGFCAAGGHCVPLATATICENPSTYVMQGALPPLSIVDPKQTLDGIMETNLAAALAGQCSTLGAPLTITTVNQAQTGILDPCTGAPLITAGNTILLVGGSWGQRLAAYLAGSGAPLVLNVTSNSYVFKSRAGTTLASFLGSQALTSSHDYFVVSLESDPGRGALVLQVWGVGWEGTPAAIWYFTNRVVPQILAGTRTWKSYQLVEWTDNGNGIKDAGDTWNVIAQDVP